MSMPKGSGSDPRYDRGRLKGGGRPLHMARSAMFLVIIALATIAFFSLGAFISGDRGPLAWLGLVVAVLGLGLLVVNYLQRRRSRGSLGRLGE